MAVSSSSIVPAVPQTAVVLRVAGSASYTTGGDALVAGTLPGVQFLGVAQSSPGNTRTYVWDNDAQKLKAFSAIATETASTTNCSADLVILVGIVK